MPGVAYPSIRTSARDGRLPQLCVRARPRSHRRERHGRGNLCPHGKGLPGPGSSLTASALSALFLWL
eukprot:4735616-Lingulodinium_polyedra.AAC.1